MNGIPKVIWFLWFQGIERAPLVVRKCLESWTVCNPGWRIVTLSEKNIAQYGSTDYQSGNLARLSPQQKADLLRLDLLAHHGGVWADATCFCVRPLDDWLEVNLSSGFFAFHRPGPDRLISSWFLAAEPDNVLMRELFEAMLKHWGDRHFRHDSQDFLALALNRLLRWSPRSRSFWFSPLIRDRLSVSPYFAIHYTFERLVRGDQRCLQLWANTPKVSADGPHRLYDAGLLSSVTPVLRSEIADRRVPVYKTSWRLPRDIPKSSVLCYLIQSLGLSIDLDEHFDRGYAK